MKRVFDEGSADEDERGIAVSMRFFWLLVLGMVLVFVGVVFVLLSASGSGGFGVVIFVGPFPIVFGAGQNVTLLILIGVVLSVVSLILFWVMNRRNKN